MTKPIAEVHTCTSASTWAIASVPSAPLKASAAMFSCWSTMPAAIEVSAMTPAMICRCFELRSSRSASCPPTPFSLPASSRPRQFLVAARPVMRTTTAAQADRTIALTSTIWRFPNCVVRNAVMLPPAMPPRLAPPPMNAEDALGLPRIEDQVGERPELADDQQAVNLAEEVEAHLDPVPLPNSVQKPSSRPTMMACVAGMIHRAGSRLPSLL